MADYWCIYLTSVSISLSSSKHIC